MLQDSPNLITQIEQLTEDVEKHIQNVEKSQSLVNDTIKNAFRKSTSPTVSEYYNHDFSNIHGILIGIWNKIITEDKDDFATIRSKITNYLADGKKFYFDESREILRLNGILIGEGNENDKQHIKQIMSGLVKNEKILENLVSLMQNRAALDKKVNEINGGVREIVKLIENEDYDTMANCCPKLWNLLRKYVR